MPTAVVPHLLMVATILFGSYFGSGRPEAPDPISGVQLPPANSVAEVVLQADRITYRLQDRAAFTIVLVNLSDHDFYVRSVLTSGGGAADMNVSAFEAVSGKPVAFGILADVRP